MGVPHYSVMMAWQADMDLQCRYTRFVIIGKPRASLWDLLSQAPNIQIKNIPI